MKAVIGIDVGTSGCKVIALSESGEILSSKLEEYPVYSPQIGWSEQDPEDWWQGTCKALKELADELSDVEIVGVGLSGQMHGMCALDENSAVIRRAILWNDQRTQKQCDEITAAAGGIDGLLSYTNNQMLTGYTGGKILWMREHEPENFKKTQIILNPKDYIRYKLTGDCCTEVSDASGTGFFDTKNRCFSKELLKKLDLSESLFPKCVESTDITGTVSAQAQTETGIKAGTPVAGGGGDAVISTTGMGLINTDRIGVTLGTSGVVAMGRDSFTPNKGGKIQAFCNNSSDSWHAMGVTLSAAGSYVWFRNTFGKYEIEQQKVTGINAYKQLDMLAEQTPAGADGLVFTPYLTGERCPHNDPDARGCFSGITSQHTLGHFARAVLEGVAFSLKSVFDLMCEDAKKDSKIVLAGGGAVSPLWRQIFADIWEIPVCTVYGSAEGGAFGAAIVAGAALKLWNYKEAADLIKEECTVLPNASNAELYRAQYQKYLSLY